MAEAFPFFNATPTGFASDRKRLVGSCVRRNAGTHQPVIELLIPQRNWRPGLWRKRQTGKKQKQPCAGAQGAAMRLAIRCPA